MPRYEFDPNAVTATIPVFAKGDYEFIVGEPKAFARTNNEGKESYGIRWPLVVAEVIEGDQAAKDKRTVYTTYMHGQSEPFAKRFAMAVMGFSGNADGERAFNEKTAGQDWDYDTDSGACGDMWRSLTGGRVVGSVDIQLYEGNQTQDWVGFRAIGT